MRVSFEILKKDKHGNFTWLESVNDFETAKVRLRQLSAGSHEKFVVFRNIDLRVVASSHTEQETRAPQRETQESRSR